MCAICRVHVLAFPLMNAVYKSVRVLWEWMIVPLLLLLSFYQLLPEGCNFNKIKCFCGIGIVGFIYPPYSNRLSPRPQSPWYNRTGWLGVKNQLTYLPPPSASLYTTRYPSHFVNIPVSSTLWSRWHWLPSLYHLWTHAARHFGLGESNLDTHLHTYVRSRALLQNGCETWAKHVDTVSFSNVNNLFPVSSYFTKHISCSSSTIAAMAPETDPLFKANRNASLPGTSGPTLRSL